MGDTKPLSLAQRLQTLGVKKSHAYMIAWGKRAPNLPLAIKIHDEIGPKLGPIATATEDEINALRGLAERGAQA